MPSPDRAEVAVLVSGGADSAILCVDLLREFARVHPVFVRFGLRWEAAELEGLERFLAAVPRPGLRRLTILDEPVAAIYGAHWSTDGPGIPDASTSDAAVYLPGRNLLLITKAAVWCRLRGIEALALGTLGANPFPDSSSAFDRELEAALNRGLEGRLRLMRPFRHLTKVEVLRRGADLPLEWTVSCLNPSGLRHCGACNKCAERRRGFRDAGLPDRTLYAEPFGVSGPSPETSL